MRPIAVLALAVTIAGVQTTQTPPSFAGRWRIIDPASASATVAYEFLVTEVTARPTITIERRFPSGVRLAQFAIASDRAAVATQNIATWMGAALVMKTGRAGPASTMPTPAAHEETWSIGAGDILYVDMTDRVPNNAPKITHSGYRRVPVLESAAPGQDLLDNPGADAGAAFWYGSADTKVEPCDGDPCFVVRNRGSFHQTAVLPRDVAGKYVVLIGSGATERINPDGAITGLPSLYALVSTSDGVHILAHLQGMIGRPTAPDKWITLSGVFLMPEGAATLSFQLTQGESRGAPPNGSAARFDRLGLYVFPSESAARSFVADWHGRDGG